MATFTSAFPLTSEELAAQLHRGLPVSLSSLLRRVLDIFSVIVVGHLGKEAMAASALASSTTNTVALSVFVGLSSGTITLVSQAVGAGDREQAGLWLHRALIVHAAAAVPLTVVLALLSPLLILMGQAPSLAADAGIYCAILLPGVWVWAALWTLTPWLQAHGIVRPQLWTSVAVACMHPFFLWLFVGAAGLGLFGAAVASSLSLVCNLAILATATLTCLAEQVPLRRPCRASAARLGTFLRLACPGVGMMGEWWASEISILASGLLPSPTLALSAMAVYQSVNAVCFMLPLGASVAGATRVGAALGGGDGDSAKRSATVCVGLGLSLAAVCSLLLLAFREGVAAAFTAEADVRCLIAHDLLPPLSLYLLADACQVCCGGVLQGCGRQRDGFPLVMASYYLVGLPLAVTLGFRAEMGAQGMVLGMLIGKFCHCGAFGLLVLRTNWAAQVRAATARVHAEATTKSAEATAAAEQEEAAAAAKEDYDEGATKASPGGASKIKVKDGPRRGGGASAMKYAQLEEESSVSLSLSERRASDPPEPAVG